MLNFESVICDDIGLYIIGKNPRLEYNSLGINENLSWSTLAVDTIRLTILNLINKGVLEIVETQNLKSFLSNLINKKNIDYYFKVTDVNEDNDWFSVKIYSSINKINQSDFPGLYDYVKDIIDTVLGDDTYNKPSKYFLIKLLKAYAKNNDWIEISTKNKFLGIYKNHNIKIKEIYIPRIDQQHKSIKKVDEYLYKSNVNYRNFSETLKKVIERDFNCRLPDNDGDID